MKKTRVVPEGYVVRIVHFRKFYGDGKYQHKANMNGHKPRPNAGLTEAWIFKGDKLVAYAEARCGKRDNFSRKIGREIATGRALKQLEGLTKL